MFKIGLFFLLFPILCLGQIKLEVTVSDIQNSPISRAIVVFYQADNQVAFGSTNAIGIIEKALPNGVFQIKIRKFGYVSQTIIVDLQKSNKISVQLQTEYKILETVVIKSRPKIMRIKEDTISYNIKAIIDGTERKVEDVIKKLPGMNVDVNGKVSYKGQEIDKVLIDGNEFFGNKHQMATQNIDAKMIDGIDLLTNYKGFSVSDQNAGSVALNLKLKEGYHNKIVGDVELSGGVNNALRTHSNLFRFSKGKNTALILDYNTIAKSPITIADYVQMRVPLDNESGNNGAIFFDLPSYMEPNNYLKRKRNGFVGLNYTDRISPKAKITVANIFNSTNILQESARTQTNLDESGSVLQFENQKNTIGSLINTQFKWEFNKSKTTFMSYQAGLTPTFDKENERNSTDVNDAYSNLRNCNYSFLQSFSINTKWYNKINYKFRIYNSYSSDSQRISIEGNYGFFGTNLHKLSQVMDIKSNAVSLQNSFIFKYRKNSFDLKTNYYGNQSRSILNSIDNPLARFSLKLNSNILISDFSWLRTWSKKWNTTLGYKSSLSILSFLQSESAIPRNEPYFTTSYGSSAANKWTFSFAVNHEFPSMLQLQENEIIKDFQILRTGSDVDFDQLIKKREFGLDYFWLNVRNQSILFSKISYSMLFNPIASNVFYKTGYSENNFVMTPSSKQFRIILQYDLKMNTVPLSLKSTVVALKTNGFVSYDAKLSTVSNKTLSVKQQLLSNFRNSPLQFDIGYNYNRRNVIQGNSNFNNSAYNYQIITVIKGKLAEKLKWDIGITRDFQNSGFNKNKLYFLNANLDYQFTHQLKLLVNGFNLLNLNTSSIIRTNTDVNFFTESVNSIIPGYIQVGFNYSF